MCGERGESVGELWSRTKTELGEEDKPKLTHAGTRVTGHRASYLGRVPPNNGLLRRMNWNLAKPLSGGDLINSTASRAVERGGMYSSNSCHSYHLPPKHVWSLVSAHVSV